MDRMTTIPTGASGKPTTESGACQPQRRVFEISLGDLPAIRDGLERLFRGFDNDRGLRELQTHVAWAQRLETALLAERKAAGADERTLNRLAGAGGSRCKNDVKRHKRRADAVAANPALAKGPANGGLTQGQLDAVATAAAATKGEAAVDPAFVDTVSGLSADEAQREARRYIDDYNAFGVNELHERQRIRRRASRQKNGEMESIVIEGDRSTIEEMWQSIEAGAAGLYENDGGREVPLDQHPRTFSQRLYDACHLAITADGFAGSGADPVGDNRGARAGGGGGRATRNRTIGTGGGRRRATLILTTTLENAAEGFAEPVELVGTGRIPRAYLAELLPDLDWAGLIYNQRGQPLWLGRTARNANYPQWLALAIRDRGCVLCTAKPTRCEAHHAVPWEAPVRGRTDIDNLCLLCGDCHHQLHHDNETLEWDPRQKRWRPRPALPHETPPTPIARKGRTNGR